MLDKVSGVRDAPTCSNRFLLPPPEAFLNRETGLTHLNHPFSNNFLYECPCSKPPKTPSNCHSVILPSNSPSFSPPTWSRPEHAFKHPDTESTGILMYSILPPRHTALAQPHTFKWHVAHTHCTHTHKKSPAFGISEALTQSAQCSKASPSE